MAIIINRGLVLRIIAGLLSSSLALISDAMHNFPMCRFTGFGLVGRKSKKKNRTNIKLYGYKRAEIIIAFVNALAMVAVMIIILSGKRKKIISSG